MEGKLMKKSLLFVFAVLMVAIAFIVTWDKAGRAEAKEGYYSIKYVSEEGYIGGKADVKEKSYEVQYGYRISYDRPTDNYCVGRAVKGWRVNDTSEVISVDDIEDYVPKGDTVFTAVWTDAYKITVKSDHACIQNSGYKNEKIIYVAKGNKIGYVGYKSNVDDLIFDCFLRDDGKSFSGISLNVPERDETYEVKYCEQIALTFDCDGGYIWTTIDSAVYTTYQKKGVYFGLTMPRPYKDHCYFAGWKLEGTDTIFESKVYGTYDHDIRVIAQWVPGYNIKFTSEDGYLSGFADRTVFTDQVKIGNKISYVPDCYNRPGYSVKGWKLAGTDDIYSRFELREITPEGDMEFEAIWETSVEIRLDANGGVVSNGIGNAFYNLHFPKGTYEKATSSYWAERPGYMFMGWKQEGGNLLFYNEPIEGTFNEDVVFKAQWVESVDITFNVDGGCFWYISNSGKYISYTHPIILHIKKGEGIDTNKVYDVKDEEGGKTFYGWKTKDSDELYTIEQIGQMKFEKDTDFYASWDPPKEKKEEDKKDEAKADA